MSGASNRNGIGGKELGKLSVPSGVEFYARAPRLGPPVERLEYGHLFVVVYFTRGTLPTKRGEKGTTGGPRNANFNSIVLTQSCYIDFTNAVFLGGLGKSSMSSSSRFTTKCKCGLVVRPQKAITLNIWTSYCAVICALGKNTDRTTTKLSHERALNKRRGHEYPQTQPGPETLAQSRSAPLRSLSGPPQSSQLLGSTPKEHGKQTRWCDKEGMRNGMNPGIEKKQNKKTTLDGFLGAQIQFVIPRISRTDRKQRPCFIGTQPAHRLGSQNAEKEPRLSRRKDGPGIAEHLSTWTLRI